MKILIDAIRQLARYPSAIAGLIIIGTLIGMSFYAVITIPYSEAIKLWQGRDGVWNEIPRNAEPKWVNLFPGINLPETFILNSEDIVSKSLQPLGGGIKKIEKRMEFDFGYDCFPQEMSLFFIPSNFRIIFQYMLPKLVPVLIPAFVMTIPAMVFLEASLAVLGLGDPLLPTWGKVLKDAWVNGALLMGHYYWVLLPSALLMMTGLGFTMVGYALDRIFNPRLRES
ncbi:hypothetical protein M1N49_02105 [Thermodesulfovibrionales bacterium]|nr:hypothetical protein [Thermodesulfovibrionales bacterium]